jgi:hypothetical protein
VSDPANPGLPVPDPPGSLSAELRPLYVEAAAVADASPASACALLRLLLRSLVQGAGMRGRHLADDIGRLVDAGAPVGLLRALDSIGMTDDEARRPAELNLANGHRDAQNLFVLVNLFVDQVPS